MNEMTQKVIDFLNQYQMDFEAIDMDEYCQVFLDEMACGLAGDTSSLRMIPTYIDADSLIPLNEPVIAIDAGGTNFRAATVHFNHDAKPVIENFKQYPMPGLDEEVTKDNFFTTIAEYTKHVIDKSQKIGFCFSYPTEIFPDKDGMLIRFCKEVQAKEVEGEIIGKSLNNAIEASGYGGCKHIVLLNDTVATLLAGKSAFQNRVFESYIGFILGTGTNCCYIEQNSNITKKKHLDPAKSQIVNVESGAFGKGPRGTIDLQFDESTVEPGMYTFEKMISGGYLGPLCLATIHVAASEGLFSKNSAEKLKRIENLETKDINDFLHCPATSKNPLASACQPAHEKDRITLHYLIDRMVERAAKLTAINISSAVIKSQKGKNPCFPVCITAEGTVFHGLKSLKQRVQYYLKSYLEEKKQCYYEIAHIADATLIGAAIAGLTN